MAKKPYAVGIDPGKVNGVALWSRQRQRFLYVDSLEYWDLVDQLRLSDPEEVEVWLEDPSKNSFIFGRNWGATVTRIQVAVRSNNMGKLNSELRKITKVAQNVGANKQDAVRIAELCERCGFEVHRIPPNRKMAKWDHRYVKAITKWEGQTNQHKRDAMRLVFGL